LQESDVIESVSALTSAIASGDPEALARFYSAWFDFMYTHARSLTRRDEAFCLDVVHDAMLRIIRSMRRMEREHELRRWVSAVVRSSALDRLRRESRRRRREAEARPASAAASWAETSSRLEWVERQMAALDDRSAALLIMRHRLGWTLKQIGAALGLGPGAVDGRLRRVTSTLRHRAQEHFHD
jgi:RNA polymerase sigma factor (sigma-70 family)